MEPTQDEQESMSYEQLQALAQGMVPQQQPAAEQPAAAQPAQPDAAQPAAEPGAEPPAETPREERQAAEAQREQRGNPAEALRQERERVRLETEGRRQEAEARRVAEENHRAAVQQLADIKAALQDPNKVRAHLKELAPEPEEAPDYDLDPEGAIQHQLKPLQAKLEAVMQELAQTKHQAAHNEYMGGLAAKYGSNFHQDLQAFDTNNKHLAHLDPEVRYLAAKGYHATQGGSDPAADAARTQELAKKMAEDMVADMLAGGKAPRGITTLGGGPQARDEGQPTDLSSLSQRDMENMSIEQMQKLLRGS